MSYNEPPEWAGRGARDRAGWPNETFSPGAPRSHRAGTPAREADTGEFRPSREPFTPDMPTEEIHDVPRERDHVIRRPIIAPRFMLERETDAVWRTYIWLGVCVRVLAIIALICAILMLGICIADKGVPLWVPRS